MNQKIFFKRIIIGFVFLIVAACSEKELEVPNSESYSRVYFQGALENPVDYSFPMKDEWYEVELGVGYGGVVFQNRDLEVDVAVQNSLIEEYNTTNGTEYPALPEESYQINTETVVIPAGKASSNSITIEINPMHLTGPRPHLLPVTILSVDGGVDVNEELSTIFYKVTGIYDENPFEKFSQENWTVHDFSSDEDDNLGGRAYHAFDGDYETIWHSQWRRDADGNRPGHPHFVAIDLNERKIIHGLEIFGRLNQIGGNGNPRDIVVELSSDGENWSEAGTYTLENTASNTIYLPTVMEARYVKLRVNASHEDVYRTHVAEIEIF